MSCLSNDHLTAGIKLLKMFDKVGSRNSHRITTYNLGFELTTVRSLKPLRRAHLRALRRSVMAPNASGVPKTMYGS